MKSEEANFNYLLPLDIPQKFNITHNFVQRLLAISANMDKSIAFQFEMLQPNEKKIYSLLNNLSGLEDKYYIAKVEYNKKFDRFLELTPFINESMVLSFSESGFIFTDIDSESILRIIDQGTLDELILILEGSCETIRNVTTSCYNRINHIMREWQKVSNELLDKIKNFEYRGMKHISNSLRVKITPELAEIQESLRAPFTEESISRNQLLHQFEEIVKRSHKDIFGNLTEEEILLYDTIKNGLTRSRLIAILNNEVEKSALIELLLENKIEIKIQSLINQLY